jgi:Ser/Thr protein kinase RdoA (MazF antagonist)
MIAILKQYAIDYSKCIITPVSTGLINKTWIIETAENKFILQKINHHIFKQPRAIAENIALLSGFFSRLNEPYLFVNTIPTTSDSLMAREDENYYRLFPFVPHSHTINTVQTPGQAFEAAQQFGRFTRLSAGLDISQLKITLPHFHDIELRYQQFEYTLKHGNPERIKQSGEAIAYLSSQKHIIATFSAIKNLLIPRVTHHDTKISNVLFDEKDKGICVIDLDTVMPGFFISDVGDMMRTYICPVSEEERDFSLVEIREDYFKAVVSGYMSEMKGILTKQEQARFNYSGPFMIYMQALRFITDYLNDDVYYGAAYPEHNFIRGCNQITLLQKLNDFLGMKTFT